MNNFAAECIAPDAPTNGSVSVSADGNQATYSCNLGYVLKGNAERWCSTEGYSWNGTAPTCSREKTLAATNCYMKVLLLTVSLRQIR